MDYEVSIQSCYITNRVAMAISTSIKNKVDKTIIFQFLGFPDEI